MVKRHELEDHEWELVRELLERGKGRGRRMEDPRSVLNGMMWILRTGAPWRDLPERYGPWESVYYHFRKWSDDGTLDRLVEALQLRLDEQGYIEWDLWCVDGSTVRAQKAAAGAGKKGVRRSRKTTR